MLQWAIMDTWSKDTKSQAFYLYKEKVNGNFRTEKYNDEKTKGWGQQ